MLFLLNVIRKFQKFKEKKKMSLTIFKVKIYISYTEFNINYYLGTLC